MGSAKKGVRMEMLLLQPSLEPELCLGKAAQWRSLCSVQSPHAQQLDALGAFFEGLEVHHSAHLTQLSGFIRKSDPGGTASHF